ncbi:hypothetical protein [Haloferula rosea]|uniref:Uncharacterized protein n=1 Tax=Haloferula rosea TaxID=490093 RepID=A0A934R6S1_9BACT|nr:hypothetical protein [Haloferula rosea]MBK1826319.1 hypothetical protein [Haloferula rosea]
MDPVLLPTTLWVLLSVVAVLQLLLLIGQLRQGRRLKRLERKASTRAGEPELGPRAAQEALEERKTDVKEKKQLFQEFLEEDPSRKELPKKEQFAEFRKWRSATGLNWVSISETGHSARENA